MFSEVLELPAWLVPVAHGILGLAMLLAGWRLARGPTVIDRIVALDLIAGLIMGQVVVMVLNTGFVSYLDVATAIAIISFLATVAFARYLETKGVS